MAGSEKRLRLFKVVNDPAEVQPDSVYMIRRGNGFDLKVSDAGAGLLLPLNCCSDGGGNTGRPYKTYTVRLQQFHTEPPMIVEEFENELGIQLSFEYQGYGRYIGHIDGDVPGKVAIFSNSFSGGNYPLATAAAMMDSKTLMLYCSEDDNNILLEIRQYE